MAALLLLPAACQNQPQAAVNAQPPAKAVEAPPPRNDLQVAEDTVRRQLGNARAASFANGVAYRNGRIAVVCGEVTRDGHRERYIAVDGRGAWLESEMRAGQMEPAVREFCRNNAALPQGHPS